MTKVGQRDALTEASTTTAEKRFWTPGRFVAILCIVNLINYVDRGVIASVVANGCSGTGIQFNPFKLVGVGLSVWTLAAVGCEFSYKFWMIAVFRMFVCIGLAAPYIDDSAPAVQRNLWLGLFYMCIPAGVALGYVFGEYVKDHFAWHWVFYIMIQAAALVFFVGWSFYIKPPQLKDAEASQIKTVTPKAKSQNLAVLFGEDLKALFCEKVFIVNVLGYITYNLVIGAYSYWGPKASFSIYLKKNADMIFGGLTIICGIIGTLVGSYALDRIGDTSSSSPSSRNSEDL